MKSLIWIGVLVGTTVGGFVPSLWGAGMFSLSGVIFSAVGGFLGIWLGYKLSNF